MEPREISKAGGGQDLSARSLRMIAAARGGAMNRSNRKSFADRFPNLPQ
jgi:hypothetical protein